MSVKNEITKFCNKLSIKVNLPVEFHGKNITSNYFHGPFEHFHQVHFSTNFSIFGTNIAVSLQLFSIYLELFTCIFCNPI